MVLAVIGAGTGAGVGVVGLIAAAVVGASNPRSFANSRTFIYDCQQKPSTWQLVVAPILKLVLTHSNRQVFEPLN